jgi:DNA replication protein DnaC
MIIEEETKMEAISKQLQTMVEQQPRFTPSMIEFKTIANYIKTKLKIDLSEEEIRRQYFNIKAVYDEENACTICKNWEDCPNSFQGYHLMLDYENGLLYTNSIKKCQRSEQREKQLKIKRLLESSRLPELYKDRTFESFETTNATGDTRKAFEMAKKYCAEGGKGIVFAGSNTGVGKTHLAAAIMNYKLAEGVETIFCTVPELFADIRRVIKTQAETSELMELVKNAELLILDDLGAERDTEWTFEQLFVILNARLVKKKDTIITTNYQKPSDLIEKLGGGITGQRIVSRIREMCDWAIVTGNDYRLR